jgi:hypothetical protein
LPNFASLKNSRLGGFEVLENKKIIKKTPCTVEKQ